MLNALRLQQGFDLQLFSLRTGLSTSVIEKTLLDLQEQGLITLNDEQWLQLTAKGQQYLNDVVGAFLVE